MLALDRGHHPIHAGVQHLAPVQQSTVAAVAGAATVFGIGEADGKAFGELGVGDEMPIVGRPCEIERARAIAGPLTCRVQPSAVDARGRADGDECSSAADAIRSAHPDLRG